MDSKSIKNYLHLYIGCDVMMCEPEGTPITVNLRGLTRERTDGEDMLRIQVYESDGDDGYEGRGMIWCDEDEIELILRPLSDMTEEESKELGVFSSYSHTITGLKTWTSVRFPTRAIPNVLRKGFDLFGLIDAGLAIKKSD